MTNFRIIPSIIWLLFDILFLAERSGQFRFVRPQIAAEGIRVYLELGGCMGDRARTGFQALDDRGIFGGGRFEVALALAQVEFTSVTICFGNAAPPFEHQVAVPHAQMVAEAFERDAGTGDDLLGGQVGRAVKFDRLAVFLIRAEGGFSRAAIALRLTLFAAICRWSVEGAFLFH